MKKKALSILLSIIAIVTIAVIVILSKTEYRNVLLGTKKVESKAATTVATADVSATSSDHVTATFDSDGTLTFSGTGNMKTDVSIESKLGINATSINKIKVLQGVTNYDFKEHGYMGKLINVEIVYISSTVTEIRTAGFAEYEKLIQITITVDTSDNYYRSSDGILFSGDYKILYAYPRAKTTTSKTIGQYALEEIASYAFYGNNYLTTLVFQSEVLQRISSDSIMDCPNLTSIQINSGNSYLTAENCIIFNKNKTELILYLNTKTQESYTIPSSVTKIGDGAFNWNYHLKSVIIPSSVTNIGENAFWNSEALTSITMPNSVISIGRLAFYSCDNLTNLIIPSNLTTIEYGTFEGCSNLQNVTIPSSVSSIGELAFCDCDAFTSITIPGNVATIGQRAFYGCDSLTSVTIGNQVGTIGQEAFSRCRLLTGIKIPIDVTSIGSHAFGDRGTSTITIRGCKGSVAETYVNNESDQYQVFETITSTVILDNQGATSAGTTSLTIVHYYGIFRATDEVKESNIMTTTSNPITKPTKTGCTFGGYYFYANGEGTQYIDENGYITSDFKNYYFIDGKTLYAKWTDAQKPTVTISRSDYNTFSWTASDNVGVTGYQITTSSTKPTSGWITTGTLTSGTYDIVSATTFYVWAVDAVGNVNDATSITASTLTRTEREHTTLTIQENNASGARIGSTTPVLNGTNLYITATANTGYTLSLKVDGSNFTSGNTKTVNANTTVETSATDTSAPVVTVTRSDYNTLSWTATDNVGVVEYKITTSSTQPTSGWTEIAPVATASGTKDISTSGTYYVWAKDDEGNVGNATIKAYTISISQGPNTTLTIQENNASGVVIGSTTSILDGTTIYVTASASTGYILDLKVAGTNFNSGTTKIISGNTSVVSSAVATTYTITLDNQSATSAGTASVTEKYNDGIYNNSTIMTTSSNPITKPTKTNYTFGGYYTGTNGSGTQMINENGYITSNFTSTYYSATGTLYAKWVDGVKPVVTITKSDYNTFSWTASDNVGVTGYQITTSSIAPLATGTGWTTSGTLTSGTKDIDSSTAYIYYVWAKDAAGNVSETKSITSYTLTRTQGPNTTLTIKENNASGAEIGRTTPVLNGTTIYVAATANTGYTASIKVDSNNFTSGNTKQISAATTVESSATSNRYEITLDNANATMEGTEDLIEVYNEGIYIDVVNATNKMSTSNPIDKPERKYTVTYNYNGNGQTNGSETAVYTFNGYYDGTTKMIDASGYLTSNFTTTTYTSDKTLNAQWNAGSVTLPTPTRVGYTFGGWYSNSGLSTSVGAAGASYTPTANITLYAKWTANRYTLTINPGGITDTQDYGTTKQITAPERKVTFNYQTSSISNIVKSAFTNWTLDENNKGNIGSENDEDTTYTFGEGNDTITANYGSVTLPSPSRQGYSFKGWYKDSNCTEGNKVEGSTYIPTQSTTLYAKWEANNYTLAINPGNNRQSGGYETTKEITAPEIKVTFVFENGESNQPINATFKQWGNPTIGSISNASANPTIYTYGLGNGTITAQYNEMELLTPTWEGHEFLGWYTSANGGQLIGNGGDGYTPTNNIVLFAQWNALEYTITVKPGEESYTQKYGTTKNIDAPEVKVTYNYQIEGRENKPITAQFKNWLLTGGTNVGSINSQTANPVEYTFGSQDGLLTAKYNDIVLELPEREGYTFGGWYSDSGLSTLVGAAGASYTPTANITLYAKWTANTYTITLNNQGATTAGTTAIYETYASKYSLTNGGSSMTTSANAITKPERKYTVTYNYNSATGGNTTENATATYIFGGYYTAANGGGTQYIGDNGFLTTSASNTNFSSNGSLYAKWTSASVTLPTPTRTGYTFGGWYSDSGLSISVGAEGANYTPTENITLYAKWTANTYAITLNNQSATTAGTGTIYETYASKYSLTNSGSAMTTSANAIDKPERKYTVIYNYNGATGGNSKPNETATYTFGGYYTETNGEGTQYIGDNGFLTTSASNTNFSSNGSLYAKWTSASVTLPTPTRTGYTFGGWYSDLGLSTSAGAAGASYTPTANITLYAKWTANTYTITLNNQGATTAGTTAIYETYASKYSLTNGGSAMTTSANAIDKPERKYTVTYNYNGATGGNSKPNETATYTFGGYYTETNGEGTQYIGDNGFLTTSASNTNFTSAGTLYAKWTASSVTLPTPTKTGYTFGGWYSDSGLSTSVGAEGANYTPTANITLYAKWTASHYEITLDNAEATTNGTSTLTEVYNEGIYKGEVNESNKMTTSSNPITKPERKYTVTYNYNGSAQANGTATATYTFNGYNDGETQMINAEGKITSNFTTTKYTSAKTLNAKWNEGSVTLPTPNAREGYAFEGWYSDSELSTSVGAAGASYTPTANITLYAKWKATTYTITLNNQGATTAGTTAIYETYASKYSLTNGGSAMTTSANAIEKPERKYTVTYNYNGATGGNSKPNETATYTFGGYYTETNGEGTQYIGDNGFLTTSASNTNFTTEGTLYAKWTASSVTLPTLTKTGYTFGGWYSDSGLSTSVGAEGANYTPTADITLYAKWTANNYEIALDNADATTDGTSTLTEVYNEGIYISEVNESNRMTTSNNPIDNPEREYTLTYNYNGSEQEDTTETVIYTFYGYYDGNTKMINANGKLTSDFTTTAYTSDKTLNARWSETVVTLRLPNDREGYTFGGWYSDEDCTEENRIGKEGDTYRPTADITLYAKWTINTYTLTINPDGIEETQDYKTTIEITAPGRNVTFDYRTNSIENVTKSTFINWTVDENNKGSIGSEEDETTTYTFGAGDDTITANYHSVELPLAQRRGYTFDGWYEDSSFDEETKVEGSTYMPTENSTLYAKWIPKIYTLTINPGNIEEPGECETSKEITAPEIKVTYIWGNGEIDQPIDATFKEWSNPTSGSISDAEANPTMYTYGIKNGTITAQYEEIELPTPTKEGHEFLGWYTEENEGELIGQGGDKFTPTDNIELYAQWQVLEYTILVRPGEEEYTQYYGTTRKIEAPEVTVTYNYQIEGKEDKTINAELKRWILAGRGNVGSISSQTANPVEYTFGSHEGVLVAIYNDIILESPERAGYVFDGWYTEEENGDLISEGNERYEPIGTITLYAHWTARTDIPYRIEHYLQKPDGTYGTTANETEEKTGTTDEEVEASAKEYAGYTEDTEHEDRKVSGNIDGDGSLVLRFYYTANTDTKYVVKHYLQNVDDEEYTKDEETTEEKEGITGDLTAAEAKIYSGFIAQSFEQKEIKGDESTVIKIYYNRSTKTPYTVKHYLQNLDDEEEYTIDNTATEQKEGKTGARTRAEAKEYPGFTVQEFEQENINGDGSTVIEIHYNRNTDTKYKVRHYLQNLENDEYEEDEEAVEEKEGTTGAQTEAEAKEYEGYEVQSFNQEEIKGDESTEIKIYYNRTTIHVTFQDYNGSILEEKTIRNGENIEYTGVEPIREKEGYVCKFSGWDKDLNNITEDTIITAQYNMELITYTIKYKNVNELFEEENEEDEENEDNPNNQLLGARVYIRDNDLNIKLSREIKVEGIQFERENPTTYTVETEDFTLCNPTAEGYSFVGWKGTGIEGIKQEVKVALGSIGDRQYTGVWAANFDTPYRVEHYKQQEDGEYPEEPDEVEELKDITQGRVIAEVKEYEGYILDEEESVLDGIVKGDGSLVLKVYYKTEPEPIEEPEPEPAPIEEPEPEPEPDPEPIEEPIEEQELTEEPEEELDFEPEEDIDEEEIRQSRITTKTYDTDDTIATKILSKTGRLDILLIISIITIVILGIVFVKKEKDCH